MGVPGDVDDILKDIVTLDDDVFKHPPRSPFTGWQGEKTDCGARALMYMEWFSTTRVASPNCRAVKGYKKAVKSLMESWCNYCY